MYIHSEKYHPLSLPHNMLWDEYAACENLSFTTGHVPSADL